MTTSVFDEINEKLREEKQRQASHRHQYDDGGKLDVRRYLSDHGIEVSKEKEAPGGGAMFCLWTCVFDGNHGPNEAAIIQAPSGRLSYQCFHDGCKGRTWADARRIISGDAKLGPWMVGGNGHQRSEPNRSKAEEDEEREAIREEGGGPDRQGPAPRFKFIHNADVMSNLRPIGWRIRDILVDDSFYYNFGEPGSYKTFVEIDRCLCIAAGIDYHGHKVKQGTVFYIAGEGQQGLGRRIAAWHAAHGTKAREVPFFIAETPTQLMDKGAVDDVRRAIDRMSGEYGHPALVSIDTLARNFGEGDENATKDMNRVVANMDHSFSNDLSHGVNHHTGHANKDRARGSIVLHAAADIAFRVSLTPDGQVLVECSKMKDAKPAPAMLFDRREVLLRIADSDDRSYVLDLVSEGDEAVEAGRPAAPTRGSDEMVGALEVLRELYRQYAVNLARGGRPGTRPHVAYRDWRKACLDRKLYKRTDVFNKAVSAMVLHRLVFYYESKTHVYPFEMAGENGGC
jgi:hypothetical protein